MVYGVLFLEVRDGREVGVGERRERTVFDGVRAWYWGQVGELGGVGTKGQGEKRQEG